MSSLLPPGLTSLGRAEPAMGGTISIVRGAEGDGEFLLWGPEGSSSGAGYLHRVDAQLRFEFDSTAIVRPLRRIDGPRCSWLLYEGFEGGSLQAGAPWSLDSFWEIGAALLRSLAECHAAGGVHGMLEPACLYWSMERRQAALLGVVRATDRGRIQGQCLNDYSAPEIVRDGPEACSLAADIYSMGAIFYQLLSGRPPVKPGSHPLDFTVMTHDPLPLGTAQAPAALGNLVMCMLAKEMRERPSAQEALERLVSIHRGLDQNASALALRTVPMVGRDHELGLLRGWLAQAWEGESSMVLLTGEAGSGKSFLIDALLSGKRVPPGLFGKVKCDQFRRGSPGSTIRTALSQVVSALLADTDEIFSKVQCRLDALDQGSRAVLVSEVPDLSRLIGLASKPGDLGASAHRNRFTLAFRQLLDALCDRRQPLCLIFDDLQWCDDATLELLLNLITGGLPAHCLLLVAFRQSESDQEFARRLLEDFSHLRSVRRLELRPLDDANVAALCHHGMPNCTNAPALAEAISHRALGNPLHCLALLQHYVANGTLRSAGSDVQFVGEGASTSVPSETVLQLLISRIGRLDSATQDVLGAAGCLGQSFSLPFLALGLGTTTTQVSGPLRDAVREGLLTVNAKDDYSFCHDRVQQAALSNKSQEFLRDVKLRVGLHYRKTADQSRECLFGCVEYLVPVRDMLPDVERQPMARLCWKAAREAKASTAYRAAIDLAQIFVDEGAPSPQARFEANLFIAECTYLAGDSSRADQLFEKSAGLAKDNDDLLGLLRTRIVLYQHEHRYEEATRMGLSGLSLLGAQLRRPWSMRAVVGFIWLLLRTRGLDVPALARHHGSEDRHNELILEFLVLLWTPSFWKSKALNILVNVALMGRTLSRGNTRSAPMAYVCFGVLKHAIQRDYAGALEYGRLAVGLLDQRTGAFISSRVRFLAISFFGGFQKAAIDVVHEYEDALKESLAAGEHMPAGHIMDGMAAARTVHGEPLPRVLEALNAHEEIARNIGAESTLELLGLVRAWAVQLANGPENDDALLRPLKHDQYLGTQVLLRMQLLYLSGEDEVMLRLARTVAMDPTMAANPLLIAGYQLFCLLASCRLKGRGGRVGRGALARLTTFRTVFPQNFASMQMLAQAELDATDRHSNAAAQRYKEALEESLVRGHELIAAICAERLAAYYEFRNEPELHAENLRVAAFTYARFGAMWKSESIRRRSPGIDWTSFSDESSRRTAKDRQIELAIEAASSIADDGNSGVLAPTLLEATAMAVGARRAFLLHRLDGGWIVASSWTFEQRAPRLVGVSLERCDFLSQSIVRYVVRTKVPTIWDQTQDTFATDPYLSEQKPRSVMCVPVTSGDQVTAVIYLENGLLSQVFSQSQTSLVAMLGRQAALAMTIAENHRLQLEAVQARVKPHFLYNALSVIAELTVSAPERAESAVLQLSRLYRYLLNSSVTQRVTLEQELSIVRDYLALEQARFGNGLALEWQVDEGVLGLSIPALLLQPLVENCVQHGVRRKMGPGTVSIKVGVEGSSLVVRVADDGPGWYESTSGNGLGVRTVVQRLKLLFGDLAKLEIVKGEGVAYVVTLPRQGDQ